MDNTRYGHNFFQIRCTECDNTLAKAQTLENLMANLLSEVYLHNTGGKNDRMCEKAKDEISLNDLSISFENELEILIPKKYEVKATEWTTSSEEMRFN